MPQRADAFDLGALGLSAGEARRFELETPIGGFEFAGQRYAVEPAAVPATVDVTRMTSGGWSLRLRFEARLTGPCMRCLGDAERTFAVDAREVDQPGGGEELDSPYVDDGTVELSAWAHDSLALALPAQIFCADDCAGLCAICGQNLNADPGHRHEAEPDPRWAKLRELQQD